MQLAVLGWIGLYLKRIRTAFWTLFVLNTTMLFMAGGLLMTTDNPLLLCWILGMVCLSLAVDKGHGAAFVLLSHCLKRMPVGVVYAVWSGVGVALITLVAWFFLDQPLDAPALTGLALIVGGVVVINVFSKAAAE